MSTKRIHSVTLPDGTVATRTSASRKYEWVVIAKDEGRPIDTTYHTSGEGWYAYRWSSSRDAAEKAAAQWRSWGYPQYPRTVRVVEVVSIEERETKQGTKRPYRVTAWSDLSPYRQHLGGGKTHATLEAARKVALKLQAEHPDAVVQAYDHDGGATYELQAGELVEVEREPRYVKCAGSGQRPTSGKFRSFGRRWQYECHECGDWATYVKSREVLADHHRLTK